MLSQLDRSSSFTQACCCCWCCYVVHPIPTRADVSVRRVFDFGPSDSEGHTNVGNDYYWRTAVHFGRLIHVFPKHTLYWSHCQAPASSLKSWLPVRIVPDSHCLGSLLRHAQFMPETPLRMLSLEVQILTRLSWKPLQIVPWSDDWLSPPLNPRRRGRWNTNQPLNCRYKLNYIRSV